MKILVPLNTNISLLISIGNNTRDLDEIDSSNPSKYIVMVCVFASINCVLSVNVVALFRFIIHRIRFLVVL